jgi:hypothetical protein
MNQITTNWIRWVSSTFVCMWLLQLGFYRYNGYLCLIQFVLFIKVYILIQTALCSKVFICSTTVPSSTSLYISSFGFPTCISYCIKLFHHFPILQSSYKHLFSCELFLSLLVNICCSKNFPPVFVSLQISTVHVPHSLLLYIAGTFIFLHLSFSVSICKFPV